MRALIFELGRDPVEDGLVAALAEHASRLGARDGLTVDVQGPDGRLPLSRGAETQLFAIGREALANVVKHARREHGVGPRRGAAEGRSSSRSATTAAASTRTPATRATSASSRCAAAPPRSAAALTIASAPGLGTVVRVEVPAERKAAGWRLSRTTRSACSSSTTTRSCAAGCSPSSTSEPDLEVVGDAAGGTQALDLLAALDSEGRRPDVVLMDLQMEPVDGIESTRQIRARYDDVEVVALTSFAEEERVHAALEAGASGYLLKDADADEVAAAVRAAHRGELQLDPAVARRLMSSLRAAPRERLEGRSSRPASSRCCGSSARARRTRRSPPSSHISERTARTHVSNILGKLGLSSRTQAALWAVREGLVDVDAG